MHEYNKPFVSSFRFNNNCSFCYNIGMLKRLSTIHSLASFLFISFIIAIADDGHVVDFINENLQNL